MTVSADTLRLLIEAGLSGDRLLAIVESIERDNTKPEGPSKGAERTRRWRARLEATGLSTDEWRALSASVIARDKGTCQYCGTTRGRMQCDHVVPLAQNGDNSEDNLVCACPACNGGKSGQTLEEWKGERWATEWRHHRGMSRDITGDVTTGHHGGHHAGDVVPLTLPLSPQTPLSPTHTPPESSTRVKGPSRLAKSSGFARFWEAYPNKVGKAAAEKSYDRAIAKIGGDDPAAVILAGLDRAKASRKWREGYIPNPTTWLNQGRWEDQPAEQAPDYERTRQNHANDHDSRAESRALWGEALALSRGGGAG